MFKFIKSEYLEIANQMRAYCKNNKITIFEKYPGIRYLASVISECGDLRRFNNENQFSSWNL
jgi:hypothetical protein